MRLVIAALLTVAVTTPAAAQHEGAPAWPPMLNMQMLTVAGTGGVGCGPQSVQAAPSSVTVDPETEIVSGTVSAVTTVACAGAAPVRVTLVSSVYHQKAGLAGRFDTGTMGPVPDTRLELLTTNTCSVVLAGAATYSCATARTTFSNGPGSRYVATSGVTYDLLEQPRGGWISIAPPACRRIRASRAYCFLAADFRA